MRRRVVVGSVLAATVLAACGVPAPLPVRGSTQVSLEAPVTAATVPVGSSSGPGLSAWAAQHAGPDLPARAVQAYGAAERSLRATDPGCHLSWTVLAGIGTVESANGTTGGAVLGADGVSTPLVRGPELDGSGEMALVPDTDRGALDGTARLDRAVGPMQILPSTWRRYASDGDGDGRADPDDLDDAALAAGRYLCVAGGDLATSGGWTDAVFAYNHDDVYVADVHAAALTAAATGS